MGDSLPPPAAIDLVGSFARRRGHDVEMVLWDPLSETPAASQSVRLTKGRVQITGSVAFVEDERGRRLVARVTRSALSDGQWGIELIGADPAQPESIGARLLVQGERPLVLLWGAKGTGSVDPAAAGSAKARATRVGIRALDSTLSVLPPQQARGVRTRIRKIGARLLT